MGPLRLDASAPGFEKDFSAFLGRNRDTDENVDRIVADIIADVRARGDAAVLEYTKKFDKVDIEFSNDLLLEIDNSQVHTEVSQFIIAGRAQVVAALSFIEAHFHAFEVKAAAVAPVGLANPFHGKNPISPLTEAPTAQSTAPATPAAAPADPAAASAAQ